MKISTYQGDYDAKVVTPTVVDVTWEEVPDLLLRKTISAGILRDGTTRRNSNVESFNCIFLDIDQGLTIGTAIDRIKDQGLKAIVGTTRNHQKRKGESPACDRFRIILFLSDHHEVEEFNGYWNAAYSLFPEMDQACKDPSRIYFKCSEIVEVIDGDDFNPVPFRETFKKIDLPNNLSRTTLDFLNGNWISGQWHDLFIRSAFDIRRKGYSYSEAFGLLKKVTGTLDSEDIRQLKDVYSRTLQYQASVSTQQPNIITTAQDRVNVIKRERSARIEGKRNALPLINKSFRGITMIGPGLTLIGGITGRGKTSTASNLIKEVLNKTSKTILVITNEETMEDVYSRVACLRLGKNWREYRDAEGDIAWNDVEKEVECLAGYLEVKGGVSEGFDMTKLEDVIMVFEHVKTCSYIYDLVVLDYFQTVNHSVNEANESWIVSKKFGSYLKEFCRTCTIPVVVFVQLKSHSGGADFKSRVESDLTLANHATVIIEIVPDFEAETTTFLIHKDRFSHSTGKKIVNKFVNGEYIPLNHL